MRCSNTYKLRNPPKKHHKNSLLLIVTLLAQNHQCTIDYSVVVVVTTISHINTITSSIKQPDVLHHLTTSIPYTTLYLTLDIGPAQPPPIQNEHHIKHIATLQLCGRVASSQLLQKLHLSEVFQSNNHTSVKSASQIISPQSNVPVKVPRPLFTLRVGR